MPPRDYIRTILTLFAALAVLCAFPARAFADETLPVAMSTAPPVTADVVGAPITDSGAAAAPSPSTEQSADSAQHAPAPPQPKIGFDLGWYLPTDKVVQSRFGSDWFSVGIGTGGVGTVTKHGQIRLDLDVEANTKGSNRAVLIPLGVQYEVGLSTGTVVPYTGLSADLVSSVVQSSTDHVRSKYRATAGGSAFAGLNFNDAANIEVRYRAMEKIAGYNLNGVGVTAGVRF